jgi:hypothetical protein
MDLSQRTVAGWNLKKMKNSTTHSGYNIRFHKTRFPELVFANLGKGEWSFFNSDEIGDPKRMGTIYHSKAELLGDLSRYAKEFGCLDPENFASVTANSEESKHSALMVPTVHRNGTNGNDLLEQLMDARGTIHDAIKALENAAPNGRDYYLKGDGAIQVAICQHVARAKALQGVYNELGTIAEGIVDQGF